LDFAKISISHIVQIAPNASIARFSEKIRDSNFKRPRQSRQSRDGWGSLSPFQEPDVSAVESRVVGEPLLGHSHGGALGANETPEVLADLLLFIEGVQPS